jgi:hypothetical protein
MDTDLDVCIRDEHHLRLSRTFPLFAKTRQDLLASAYIEPAAILADQNEIASCTITQPLRAGI